MYIYKYMIYNIILCWTRVVLPGKKKCPVKRRALNPRSRRIDIQSQIYTDIYINRRDRWRKLVWLYLCMIVLVFIFGLICFRSHHRRFCGGGHYHDSSRCPHCPGCLQVLCKLEDGHSRFIDRSPRVLLVERAECGAHSVWAAQTEQKTAITCLPIKISLYRLLFFNCELDLQYDFSQMEPFESDRWFRLCTSVRDASEGL